MSADTLDVLSALEGSVRIGQRVRHRVRGWTGRVATITTDLYVHVEWSHTPGVYFTCTQNLQVMEDDS